MAEESKTELLNDDELLLAIQRGIKVGLEEIFHAMAIGIKELAKEKCGGG